MEQKPYKGYIEDSLNTFSNSLKIRRQKENNPTKTAIADFIDEQIATLSITPLHSWVSSNDFNTRAKVYFPADQLAKLDTTDFETKLAPLIRKNLPHAVVVKSPAVVHVGDMKEGYHIEVPELASIEIFAPGGARSVYENLRRNAGNVLEEEKSGAIR